ncbi:hypothetical protein T03_396 [Trichinella britovi]|uniref:Uncharacterized protein n=1 Tax=Trichinella britovi TaxID=45882 RepID=A0A0V1ARX9_TRIBR|nr:hypothetical protein T03_396 [Trichinella britovi]
MTKPVPQISMSFSWEPRKPLGLSNLSCQDINPKFPWSPH